MPYFSILSPNPLDIKLYLVLDRYRSGDLIGPHGDPLVHPLGPPRIRQARIGFVNALFLNCVA